MASKLVDSFNAREFLEVSRLLLLELIVGLFLDVLVNVAASSDQTIRPASVIVSHD
jgi:hypothetical protein